METSAGHCFNHLGTFFTDLSEAIEYAKTEDLKYVWGFNDAGRLLYCTTDIYLKTVLYWWRN